MRLLIPRRPVTQIESRLFGLLFCTQSKNGHVRVVCERKRALLLYYGTRAYGRSTECFLRD